MSIVSETMAKQITTGSSLYAVTGLVGGYKGSNQLNIK